MFIFSLILIAVLTGIDQLIKLLVVTYVKPVEVIDLIPNLLQLRYLENTGAVFGSFEGAAMFFALLTPIACAVIIFFMYKFKNHNFFTRFASICVVAGGLGNFVDRVAFGYVIDYIYVMFFPYVFNFADMMVVGGVISFIIYIIFYMDRNDKKAELEKASEAENE